MPASSSATTWTRAPTNEAGAVAPACGADTSDTGIPARTAAVNVSTVSLAKRSGLTMKPRLNDKNGRSRNAFSPPASRMPKRLISATFSA